MSEYNNDSKQDYQQELAARRKGAVRTALILAVVALVIFIGFIWVNAASA